MKEIKSICIITNKYPNKCEPNVLVFVQQLVWQFARMGVSCTVICPMPINRNFRYWSMKSDEIEYTDTGECIRILRPKYFSLGQTKILGINPAKFSTKLFEISVLRTLKKYKLKPDVLYSHFITPAGIAAARVGRILNIPTFMAHGEATTMTIEDFGGAADVAKELKSLKGVIAVSSHNKNMLTSLSIIDPVKIAVFPNAYNPKRFYKVDKVLARKYFGFNKNDFIVGFVGSFDERKGISRLEKAIENIDGVDFACAGKGRIIPKSSKCIYKNPVEHDSLVYFYNSCDIFVLPTRMEGCCNAIVEAIACGLPIISSDRIFNHDILDKSNSILIEPDDIDEIERAIRKLYLDKDLRIKLSNGSNKMSNKLTIDCRSQNILRFMNDLL